VAIVFSLLLWFTDSDYPFSNVWPLCFLFYFDSRILIIPLVSCGHCVVCSTLIYGFWLPLWYLVAIVLSVLLWFTDSDYPFNTMATRYQRDNQNPWIKVEQKTQWSHITKGIIRICESKEITPLVSCGYCVVCSTLIQGFWLSLWYLVAIVLSVLLWFTDSDYSFGILWPLCFLFSHNGHKIPKG
jgi:hypothetical protein